MAKIKMTPKQKDERKALLGLARSEGVKLVHNFQTTIAYKEFGDVVRFATALHSPKDPANDFSRKYGEYIALERALNGNTSPMLAVDFNEMLYCMDMYTHAEHKNNNSY